VNVTIWMYWESPGGAPRAPYLDLCEETVRRHAPGNLVVLDDRTISDFLPRIRDGAWKLSPNHRSDYFRSRLLHLHGGVWLDADVVAFDGLSGICEMVQGGRFVGYGRDGLSANLFGAPSGDPIVERWMDLQDRILDSEQTIGWNALGKDSLMAAVDRRPIGRIDVHRVAPLPWEEWWRPLSRFAWVGEVLDQDQATVMLYNRFLGQRLRGLKREQLLGSSTLLGQLIRIALGHSSVEEEWTVRRLAAPLARAYWRMRTAIPARMSGGTM
jgi:hypothetical protein